MHFFPGPPLLFAYTLSLAALTGAQAPEGSCDNPQTTMQVQPCVAGVHIIAVRGSNQSDTADQGEGTLLPIVDSIIANIPDSNGEGLQYPDSPAHKPCYDPSEETGVADLTNAITNYANRCPGTRIVLLGASQGAQVVADTLCGSVLDSSSQGPLNPAVGNHIAAIALFGELSRNHTAPWNRGNASVNTANGVSVGCIPYHQGKRFVSEMLTNIQFFPRPDLAPCQPYANKMASYCQSGDYWCDSSYGVSEDEALYIHGMEDSTYREAAIEFVLQTLDG